MKLLDYGSSDWDTHKSVWLVIGADISDRDVFAAEFHKHDRWGFSILAQVGGDCLIGFSFHVGKFSGGFNIWGH